MLLWVPQALLALLLPTLLVQGEGKGTVGKHTGFGWPPAEAGQGMLHSPKGPGKEGFGVGGAAGKSGILPHVSTREF